jgi:hypothetical protein
MGTRPTVKIQNNVKVEARAQTGLGIEGETDTPEVISIKQTSTKENIKLNVIAEVTEIKDVRPVYKRMLGGTPDYRDVVIPKLLELRPEKVGEGSLEYQVTLKENQSTFKMLLIFLPGMSKNRDGCGGDIKFKKVPYTF